MCYLVNEVYTPRYSVYEFSRISEKRFVTKQFEHCVVVVRVGDIYVMGFK